ncbi:MAG: recombinase family protein [Candidatus Dormibacteraceae bacterium]
MAKIERIRELAKGWPDATYLKQKEEAGWRLVALEWRRDVEGEELPAGDIVEDVPYGVRVADDCLHLVEDTVEMHTLVLMMELIVQDHPLSEVASALNSGGFRTRRGARWSPVSVFNMLPRLIEVGPKIFSTEEWEERRKRLVRAG